MIAIAVNAATIIIGSLIGLLINKNVKKSLTDAIIVGIGFFTVYMGIMGLNSSVNSIIYLLSIIFGGIIGTALQIEEKLNKAALKVQNRFAKDDAENRFASGLAGFFIMSCVGAFTIVASFNAGLGDNTMLYTKSVMDFIVSLAMASTLGIGVLFAVIPTVLYEGLLVCFSSVLSSLLGGTMIEAFSCMGAILTIAIGTNVAGVSKFKVVNYVPCLIFAPLFAFIFEKLF